MGGTTLGLFDLLGGCGLVGGTLGCRGLWGAGGREGLAGTTGLSLACIERKKDKKKDQIPGIPGGLARVKVYVRIKCIYQ